MDNDFFKKPILNSPYEYPVRHWELDVLGQPTQRIIESRRRAEFIVPVPKARKHKAAAEQKAMVFDEGKGLSTQAQQYDPTPIINELRQYINPWRQLRNPSDWHVTPETARLLQHWRHHKFGSIRPFFCQVEAAEVAIWLFEVAPALAAGKRFLEHLENANQDANPGLSRLALKLATGAGKTTVMAMLIAWQTINAVRRPGSKKFTRGFLVVTPGLTIRDRLRVLQPNDPDAYYQARELVPPDMLTLRSFRDGLRYLSNSYFLPGGAGGSHNELEPSAKARRKSITMNMEKEATMRGSHLRLSRCLGAAFFPLALAGLAICLSDPALFSQQAPWVAPSLPGGQKRVVYCSPDLLTKPFYVGKVEGFSVAKHPPTVIFSYLPGQDYRPRRAGHVMLGVWSHWGQGTVINGKYYVGYGDHTLTGRIAEWDPETGESRVLVDVTKFLSLPKEYYTSGKVHSYLTLGKDGWLYYSTGDEIPEAYIYNGDWILRTRPETGKTEIVAQGPAGPYSIPNGFADPERMIFLGTGEQQSVFFAYDLVNRRLLYKSPLGEGGDRGMPYAQSTGRIYYRGNMQEPYQKRLDNLLPELEDSIGRESPHPWGIMRRWDVKSGEVVEIRTECNPRAATRESREGVIWIATYGGKLWKLDVASETFTPVANLAVMSQAYITSLVLDSTGRYLYYCPGAHGTACNDGTPIFQYDVKTGKVKAICFLTPATLTMGLGYICAGTFGMALSPDDSTLFVTWNGFRPAFHDLTTSLTAAWSSAEIHSWDVCAVTAIRIPPEERIP